MFRLQSARRHSSSSRERAARQALSEAHKAQSLKGFPYGAGERKAAQRALGAEDFIDPNVLGAQTLFDACLRAGTPRVVHIGTDEVYGSIPEGSWTEDEPLLPNSPYSAAKAGAGLSTHSFIKAMDTMTIPTDMFGSAPASFTATKRLGSDVTRLSQLQDARWKVMSEYFKPQ